MTQKARTARKTKPRKGMNMNFRDGDHFVFEGGKGVARFEVPKHIRVRRERQA